jgi:N-acetylglucosaminyldiphosphoundecaprenol N-acetyl-beta-D-mannosaminyltransferase
MGFNIFHGNIEEFISHSIEFDQQAVINCMNAHSYAEQLKDNVFKDALLESNFLLPDGISITIAAKFLNKTKIAKVSGYDLFESIMEISNKRQLKVLFFGSNDHVLNKIRKRALIEYPYVKTFIYSPPYKDDFTDADMDFFKKVIKDLNVDIIFFGLTAPKQEKLILRFRGEFFNSKIIAGIGAVFDFYAETKKRPSKFLIDIGLEWLGRFVNEPIRLFKRVFVSNAVFALELLRYKFRKR